MKRTEIVSVRLATATKLALENAAKAENRSVAGYLGKLIQSDLLTKGTIVPVPETPERRGRPGVKRARLN
jgi:hypothetical protein